MKRLDFGTDFGCKKREFRLVLFMEIIVASVKLMLAFESPKLDLYSSSYGPFSRTARGCPILTPYTIHILGLISGWEK